jgi:UDP-3-O-[3-hydroxymyristoyl] glucosamine N-acyltransferase
MNIYNANEVFEYLKDQECNFTCSLDNPKSNALSFLKNENFLDKLFKINKEIFVVASRDILNHIVFNKVPSNINILLTHDDVNYVFAEFHNKINKNRSPKENIIGKNCEIHKTVITDIDGQRIINRPDGSSFRLKHMGNVVMGDNVRIDAMTTMHRASLDSTSIGSGSTLGTHVNIGHNCIIGENTFIAPGCKIAGSVKIGKNCNIWQGCLVGNGISVCDNVSIGMGSVVTRDLCVSGLYYGSPAKLIRAWDGHLGA